MDAVSKVKFFRNELKKFADPRRAEGEKQYLKSALKHYGVTVPKVRKIAQAWLKTHSEETIDEVCALSQKLWDSNWHEEKSLAIELLTHRSSDLTSKHLPLVEKMIRSAKTWAHIDNIAVLVVGALIETDAKILRHLPKWSKSENFWVRRTAILAQMLQFRKGKGDFKLFSRIVVPMFNEGEQWSKEERFFIRKAIGWTLRELSKSRPELVFNFIKRHKDEMSGLTFREGSRNLPPVLQAKFHTQ